MTFGPHLDQRSVTRSVMNLNPLDRVRRKPAGSRHGEYLNARLPPKAHLLLYRYYVRKPDALALPMSTLNNNPLPPRTGEPIHGDPHHRKIATAIWRTRAHEPLWIFVSLRGANEREHQPLETLIVKGRP